MINNLMFVAFNSTKRHGVMNTNKSFFNEVTTPEERKAIMEANKRHIEEEIGFDWKKLFYPIQKTTKNSDKYEDGKSVIITPEIVSEYDNLYDFDVYADIAKITRETPYVAIANNLADCANVIAVNKRTNEAVVAHCGGEYINRFLPSQTIDALGGSEQDIEVYVSPFAHELIYTNGSPVWTTNNNVWDGCIKETDGKVVIDQLKALRRQLIDRKIPESNIEFSPFSTITCKDFYSNSNAYNGVVEDNGRFVSGVALVEARDYGNNPYVKKF